MDEDWNPNNHILPSDSEEGSATVSSSSAPDSPRSDIVFSHTVPGSSPFALTVFTTPPGVVIPPSVQIPSPRGDVDTAVTSGSLAATRKAHILSIMKF